MKKSQIALISVACVAAVVAAGYGIGAYYYSSHFGSRTFINGHDVSNLTAIQATDLLKDSSDLSLTVKEREDVTEEIVFDDIDYEIHVEDSDIMSLLASQNPMAWPMTLFQDTNIEKSFEFTYDEDALDEKIMELHALSADDLTDPKDAYIDLVDDVYEIIPEVQGTKAIEDKTKEAVKTALSEEQTELDLSAAECYPAPSVTSEDEGLQNALSILQDINNMTLTIDMSGAKEELQGKELADLFIRNADNTVSVDETKLTAYVENLESTYNTLYTTRPFKTTGGADIEVGGGSQDTYGWLMNAETTATTIRNALNAKTTAEVAASWDVSAWTRDTENGDIGKTYIEISIADQHLWYYQNGELFFETDVVTGKPSHNQNTPVGAFRIWNKQRNATLKGTAWDGSKWSSPVSFWMPIDWTGVGLHDATWQPAFGGQLYYSIGSHGCVNLPYSAAQTIFNNVEINTPVIIY